MTGFLASVTSMAEAEIALAGGADILDLKDPSRGALGALPTEIITACVAGIAQRRIVSATAGDLAMEPDLVRNAVRRLSACGVDIVKIGLFPGGDILACISALRDETVRGTRLVAVMFADQAPEFSLIGPLREAGLIGVMLDTADKSAGGLRHHLDGDDLADFVEAAKKFGLMSGLAGSLRLEDVAPLAALQPDYLGFRGGICDHGRQSALSPERLRAVRSAIDNANIHQRAAKMATAAAGAQRAAHSVSWPSPLTSAVKST
ncbi:MAG: (5-formylfuran-3-yl)methyl phosphate synthase [Dongiaceae bacterium]